MNKIHTENKKIVYVVPSLGIYGGIIVVLQHANRLIKRGHDVSILSMNEVTDTSWFPGNTVQIFKASEKNILISEGVDIAIATHFSTVNFVKKMDAERKLYFVQSDERRFDLGVDDFIRCEKTYKEDFEFVTMAKWIQRWLKEEFNKDAYYVPNGLDIDVFHKTDPVEKKTKKIRILIEGSINTPFKGVDDSYEAVCDLDCEIWFVSNDGVPKQQEWRYDRFFEKVPMMEMKKIYSACDILLKMSKVESFCYPPLEMMACGGVSIVRKVTGIEEYAINEENCLIVSDVKSAGLAVQRLIEDKELRNKLIENGKKTAEQWNWDKSIDLLEKVIKKEPLEVFYTDTFPERYDFNEGVKTALLDTIGKLKRERDFYYVEADKARIEIDLMKNSAFWKMRNAYLNVKNMIFFPMKKILKYSKKITYLLQSLFATFKNEGIHKTILRLYNFIKYGKGVLKYDEEAVRKEKYTPLKEVMGKLRKL